MDVRRINHNFTFYQGYEGEPEIVLSLPNHEAVHIWEGYFDDIYNTPSFDGKGWNGFTRDYQQIEGIFAVDGNMAEIDPKEYLEDLMQYKNKVFRYEKTAQVFDLMVAILKKAIESGTSVRAEEV